MSSYKDLDIYKISLSLFYEAHPMSLKLPKHELYELGSQLRRSSDSIVTNIVEGYGRSTYKAEFVRFLIFSWSSSLETINHLEKIKHLYGNLFRDDLIQNYEIFSAKIYSFIKYVENNWK